MSRRPRLVHEGSPILDDDGDDESFDHYVSASFNNNSKWKNTNQTHQYSSSNDHNTSAPKPKFKLQTRLVIGGETTTAALPNNRQHEFNDEDSLDEMMTDDAENDNIFSPQPVQHHHQHQDSNFNFMCSQNKYQHQIPQPTIQIHHMPPRSKAPLVVIDGANIAYNYAESLNPSLSNQHVKREPNPKGITVCIQYFLQRQCRVQAVVPISWYKLKPRPGDHACAAGYKGNLNQRDDAKMLTEEVEELRMLRQHGFLVAVPPGDDDDSYAISLARREEERLLTPQQHNMHDDGMMMDDEQTTSCLPMGGYVVSNDFFHDAAKRDERQQKDYFHYSPAMPSLSQQSSKKHSLKAWLKHHRISYSFANVGLSSAGGDVELEFLPNPRNELIEAIDAHYRLSQNT
ncbi:hypothetical protein ACHAWO_006821 [Cyclotella atomus]|uniref:RNase NYN domain-containing protein n=1 Tax=Cyclotella atomus TaxID=382360 RepID=A0ABD3PCU3_9STRA